MAEQAPTTAEEARLRRVLIAAALALFCVQLDFLALNLALPKMAADLSVTPTDLQWAVSGYMLTSGALVIVCGRLGDIFGRRRTLLAGVVIFAAAAGLGGAAPSAEAVIAARIWQGLGAALIFPVAIAVITNEYPEERRARAIGLAYGIAAIGTALGPFVGGVVTEALSWRWVLWINVPLAVGAIAAGLGAIRESRDETVPRHIDIPGVVAVSLGIASLTFAVDRGEVWGWGSANTLGVIALGAALLVAFVLVERRVRLPLIDLKLFRNVPYDVVTASGAIANTCYVVTVFGSTLYLQQVRHLSPLEAGVVFLAQSAGAAAAGPLAGRLGGRWNPAYVMAAAIGVGGAGLLALTSSGAWAIFVPAFAVTGLGFGLGWAFASVGTQAVVRPERAGEASGVTLTALVTVAGFAVAGAATALELLRHDGTGAGTAIHDVLRVLALLAIVAAAATALAPRVLRPEPATAAA